SGAVKLVLPKEELAPAAVRVAVVVTAAAAAFALWRGAHRPGGRGGFPVPIPPFFGLLAPAGHHLRGRGAWGRAPLGIWYFEPHLLAAALVVGALPFPTMPRVARALAGGAVAVAVLLAGVSWQYRLDPRSYELYAAAERSAHWLDANARPDAVAAAWDA